MATVDFKSWLMNLEEGGFCSRNQCQAPAPTPSNNKERKASWPKSKRRLGPGGSALTSSGGGGGMAAMPAAAPPR